MGSGADKVVLHVVTAPGKEAQVDFGSVGKLRDEDGRSRNAYVFVMTLAHSRLAFHKTVFEQKAETWQQLHVDAFKFFGGVPEVVVPDNLKSAVLKAAFTSSQSVELNLGYRELARYFGFRIDPTPHLPTHRKRRERSSQT
ncbi:MAG: transposase family protein [Deltaproteobacteria bacterium]|nr:transposase family protein [Deltaproteobacteria bacterium]